MIIEGLFNLGTTILEKIMFIKFPALPEGVMDYVDQLFGYMATGAGILANYTPFSYLMTLLSCLLLVEVLILAYHLIMWVLEKIPFVNVDR